MAESKTLRKPIFTKVDQLRPGTSGHTLIVKVVSTNMVVQKGRADGPQVRQMRIAECLWTSGVVLRLLNLLVSP
ncbi:hypothetical protein REPUB_Repub02eG0169700 [Reevesia pubescens]